MSTIVTRTPVFAIQRSQERYHAQHGWLDTYHSLSFAEYVDPANVQWGALRVLNDDTIAGGQGFPPHPHRDMEILTYVLSGALEHRDSMGNHGVVGPGGVQYMSAGTGVRHSEFNHDAQQPLHLVQMWVLPNVAGATPLYGQREFTMGDRVNRWLAIASGRATFDAPVELRADASFHVARVQDATIEHRFDADRYGFLFVCDGTVEANGERLAAGDAVRIANIERLAVHGSGELLLWDVAGV